MAVGCIRSFRWIAPVTYSSPARITTIAIRTRRMPHRANGRAECVALRAIRQRADVRGRRAATREGIGLHTGGRIAAALDASCQSPDRENPEDRACSANGVGLSGWYRAPTNQVPSARSLPRSGGAGRPGDTSCSLLHPTRARTAGSPSTSPVLRSSAPLHVNAAAQVSRWESSAAHQCLDDRPENDQAYDGDAGPLQDEAVHVQGGLPFALAAPDHVGPGRRG